jgi:hypothetical protein
MIPGGYEALVTVREDADFGPVLTFGTGGHLVELVNDVVHLSIPCSATEIWEALGRTRLSRILSGLRGRPAGDAQAFVTALLSFSRAYLSLPVRPAEIELNPLLVLPEGDGVIALDVLAS